MDTQYYEKQFALEDSHWWYLGRRAILHRLMTRYCGRPAEHALEIGCGGGGNLATLAHFAKQISAIEMDATGAEVAIRRQLGEVDNGKLGDDLPVLKRSYDIVGMFDVLEHIPDDAGALKEIGKLLHPGGRALIMVPAYMFLWTRHDEIAHHHRRYTRGGLCNLLEKNGFKVVHASYFNTLLFPLAVTARMLTRYLNVAPEHTITQPPRLINRLLAWTFSLEAGWVSRWSLPFGLSIAVVAERDEVQHAAQADAG